MANWKAVSFNLGNGVVLEAEEAFKHTLAVGTAGSGKTHLLTSVASQLVNERAAGNEIGFTVIGLDLPGYVAKMCEENKIPFLHLGRSVGFNPLAGSAEEAAELAASLVEQSQDFWSTVQRVAIRNTVLLLKRTNPDATLFDVLDLLRDRGPVKPILYKYKDKYGKDDLARYFEDEVVGNDKFREFVLGLRLQLEDLLGDRQVKQILVQKEYVDFDKLLADGGILLVEDGWAQITNTALDNLILRALLRAVWRRKPNGRPHYVLVDTESPCRLEYTALQMGRSYRCGFFFTAQTLRGNKKDLAMMCKNKVVFHAMPEDAEFLARELGTTAEELWELPYFHFKSNIGQGTPTR